MAFTSINVQAFAGSTENNNAIAKEIYENLSPEAQRIFLDSITSEAMSGDDELLKYHKENIDSSFKGSTDIMVSRVRVFTGLRAANVSASASLASDLKALGLPTAVRYAFTALGAAIAVPGEVILDAAAAIGLGIVIAIYWKEISRKWYKIERVFRKHYSSQSTELKKAFRNLKLKAQGLPNDEQFSNFDDHHKKHAKEFANMPGGGGKKPDKKKYWEMAKKFLKKKGRTIKEGVEKDKRWLRVKFDTKTLEFMIYNPKTMQIITYYLPKWKNNYNNYTKWAIAAYNYFKNSIK